MLSTGFLASLSDGFEGRQELPFPVRLRSCQFAITQAALSESATPLLPLVEHANLHEFRVGLDVGAQFL